MILLGTQRYLINIILRLCLLTRCQVLWMKQSRQNRTRRKTLARSASWAVILCAQVTTWRARDTKEIAALLLVPRITRGSCRRQRWTWLCQVATSHPPRPDLLHHHKTAIQPHRPDLHRSGISHPRPRHEEAATAAWLLCRRVLPCWRPRRQALPPLRCKPKRPRMSRPSCHLIPRRQP